jgi:hypothetical protein
MTISSLAEKYNFSITNSIRVVNARQAMAYGSDVRSGAFLLYVLDFYALRGEKIKDKG